MPALPLRAPTHVSIFCTSSPLHPQFLRPAATITLGIPIRLSSTHSSVSASCSRSCSVCPFVSSPFARPVETLPNSCGTHSDCLSP
eukprot:13892082-Alexandrium_andersonii.AAC.1